MFNPSLGQVTAIRWLPCQNNTANDIPGFAVMRVTGVCDPSTVDNQIVLQVDQPNGSDAIYCVNGPNVIKAQSGGTSYFGACSLDFPNMVLYDSNTGTPAVNDVWGPKSGSWKLAKNYTGFRVFAQPTAGRVLVTQSPGTGAWIGILQGTLAYGSSASVTLYQGTPGSETAGSTVTCYPWMMNTGDSIATHTGVVGCVVNGYYYVFNAGCKNVYGS